jgi:hypothetical protein
MPNARNVTKGNGSLAKGQAESGYNKGTIRGDIRHLVVSRDIRRHRLISISYISQGRCHGRGREFESRRPRHSFQEVAKIKKSPKSRVTVFMPILSVPPPRHSQHVSPRAAHLRVSRFCRHQFLVRFQKESVVPHRNRPQRLGQDRRPRCHPPILNTDFLSFGRLRPSPISST